VRLSVALVFSPAFARLRVYPALKTVNNPAHILRIVEVGLLKLFINQTIKSGSLFRQN
jgi:hypothetical protein